MQQPPLPGSLGGAGGSGIDGGDSGDSGIDGGGSGSSSGGSGGSGGSEASVLRGLHALNMEASLRHELCEHAAAAVEEGVPQRLAQLLCAPQQAPSGHSGGEGEAAGGAAALQLELMRPGGGQQPVALGGHEAVRYFAACLVGLMVQEATPEAAGPLLGQWLAPGEGGALQAFARALREAAGCEPLLCRLLASSRALLYAGGQVNVRMDPAAVEAAQRAGLLDAWAEVLQGAPSGGEGGAGLPLQPSPAGLACRNLACLADHLPPEEAQRLQLGALWDRAAAALASLLQLPAAGGPGGGDYDIHLGALAGVEGLALLGGRVVPGALQALHQHGALASLGRAAAGSLGALQLLQKLVKAVAPKGASGKGARQLQAQLLEDLISCLLSAPACPPWGAVAASFKALPVLLRRALGATASDGQRAELLGLGAASFGQGQGGAGAAPAQQPKAGVGTAAGVGPAASLLPFAHYQLVHSGLKAWAELRAVAGEGLLAGARGAVEAGLAGGGLVRCLAALAPALGQQGAELRLLQRELCAALGELSQRAAAEEEETARAQRQGQGGGQRAAGSSGQVPAWAAELRAACAGAFAQLAAFLDACDDEGSANAAKLMIPRIVPTHGRDGDPTHGRQPNARPLLASPAGPALVAAAARHQGEWAVAEPLWDALNALATSSDATRLVVRDLGAVPLALSALEGRPAELSLVRFLANLCRCPAIHA
jgi:hypothetical protein